MPIKKDRDVPVLQARLTIILTFLASVLAAMPAMARPSANPADPALLCASAIATEERRAGIPRHLLGAIALAESGRWDKARKATVAWPWTIMAEGNGQYFPTKAEALAEARALRARGVRNMDVGCMQINMMYHGEHFASLEEAFEPSANVAYAARFLRNLHGELGSWHEAAGRYHSATPQYNIPYKRKIARLWEEQQQAGGMALAALPPVADPELSTASSRAAKRNGSSYGGTAAAPVRPDARPVGRTIIPVDYDRMARLAEAWRARTGRTTVARAAPTTRQMGGGTGIRTAGRAATFAAKRREYLQAWRQNHGALAMN